ncbi:MAG: hypothetical protein IPM04_12005 [Saprospiraceae bacterium]|nr:hypothetical protein [Candidatus Brachybacter algidus]MBK8748553.1 hypothetical protein [Candidatus Brachybacter algidus]
MTRVVTIEWTFEELFEECYGPIWDYGKNDLYIQNALTRMLEQLKMADVQGNHHAVFNIFINKIKAHKAEIYL